MSIRRGETHLAALDPMIGKEVAKTRPVVVVSNDINNEYSGTVTVLPITSASLEKVYPFEVFLPKGSGRLPKDSKAKADQIRTLDKARLVKRIGKLENTLMEDIEAAIRIHLELGSQRI